MKNYFTVFLLIILPFVSFSQRTIKGKVTDMETGEGLIGVTILVMGTTTGALTDVYGDYSIVVPDMENPILAFSYTGYETQEINVEDSNVINVQLISDIETMGEIVLSGYSSQKLRIRGFSSISASRRGKKTEKAPSFTSSDESYAAINENIFKSVKASPLSTFSIDVDKASYSNVRRFINEGNRPPKDAVRIEEMVNYFNYDYLPPTSEHPIVVHSELGDCPWNTNHKLVKIGLKSKEIPKDNLPYSNLVFLLDVSGSMGSYNKLPLVKKAMQVLVDQLRQGDKVSIVVYAGAAGLVLPPTDGSNKDRIMNAMNKLKAGGSTAGGAGIQLAYKIATEQFIEDGNNRIILATDGDFNVGMSSDNAMEKLIEEKRQSGIYLTCLGFGMGNYKDSKLEILADKGNGNYAYIDNQNEAKKVFHTEFSGTMFTLAKDVKFQLVFNPNKVAAYRLIGYENRLLDDEDFDDDTKDAGEIGVGHTVTALYEIIPTDVKSKFLPKDKESKKKAEVSNATDLFTVKLRYKPIKSDKSIKLEYPILYQQPSVNTTDFHFASSVALFGMLLRDSKFAQDGDFDMVLEYAEKGKGKDKNGYRKEFIQLVKKADKEKITAEKLSDD